MRLLLSIGSCVTLVLLPLAAQADAPGDRPSTAEERIRAATVPPPGKDCPPDPDESARVGAQANEAAIRVVTASAAETVSIAKQAVYAYWQQQRVAFAIHVEAEAQAAHAARPTATGAAPHPFLNRSVCEQMAERDPAVCSTGADDPRAAFQCRALFKMSHHRVSARGGCDASPPWFEPTCRLLFDGEAVDPCSNVTGPAQNMCLMVEERLDPPGGVCAAPYDPHGCGVEMMLGSMVRGTAVCAEAAANSGLDPANARRLSLLCEAAALGEPERCAALTQSKGEEQQLSYTPIAQFQGGFEGVRALVGMAANSPVACAVTLDVRDGDREVASAVTGGVWPGGKALLVKSEVFAQAADPFRHQLRSKAVCVPTVPWEGTTTAQVAPKPTRTAQAEEAPASDGPDGAAP